MSESRHLKLHNNAIIAIDDIQLVFRQGISKYGVVLRGCPAVVDADGDDVKAIEEIIKPRSVEIVDDSGAGGVGIIAP